jgi:hypothetical protein
VLRQLVYYVEQLDGQYVLAVLSIIISISLYRQLSIIQGNGMEEGHG